MGTVGHGHNLQLGWGEETTWGTAVARTKFMDVLSESIAPSRDPVRSGGLDSPGIKIAHVAAGLRTFAGEIRFEVLYKDWEVFLKHLLGSVSSAQTNGTAYTHTFTIANALPTGLTVEVYRDSDSFVGVDDGKAFLYSGCKVNTATFEAAVGAYLTCTMGLVAKDEARAAKTTGTLSTGNLAVFTQGAFTYDGGTLNVESFRFTVNNNLDVGKTRLGSATIFQPTRDGKIEVTGSFTLDHDTFGRYDDFIASTTRLLTLVFTGGAISGSNQNETITITFQQVKLEDFDASTDDPGEYREEIGFRAYRGTSKNEVEFAIINNNTTVSA